MIKVVIHKLLSFSIVSKALFLFLIENLIYQLILNFNMQNYWILIPTFIYFFISIFLNTSTLRNHFLNNFKYTNLLALIFMYLSIEVKFINIWFSDNYIPFSFFVTLIFFTNFIVGDLYNKKFENASLNKDNGVSKELFNLFYINTSKAHEIAMLIDNKIMKTIENEHTAEDKVKYNLSARLGRKELSALESGYSQEDSTKKRVFENFDVKTTKSIMLRKIYESTQKSNKNKESLKVGDLLIFENIQLQQQNTDDTIMILNVLRDSNLKNQSSDSLEINLTKMMDTMLDDFTIDYTFSSDAYENSKNLQYIVQIPYKSTENFENGYHHNDLQLGTLSIIGVYRGEIDFSSIDNLSSKFLEIMSNSYNSELQKSKQNEIEIMKLSNDIPTFEEVQFEFKHKKLSDKLHLIDIIAIIQQLNIYKDDNLYE